MAKSNRLASARAAVLATFALFAMSSGGAEAASCNAMANELRQLERSGGGSARHKRALDQQYAALRKVERALKSNQCSRRRSNACNQYVNAQRKMLANVGVLKRKAGGRNTSARQASLRKQIQRSCNTRSARNSRPNLLDVFRGNKQETRRAAVRTVARTNANPARVERRRSSGDASTGSARAATGGGGYRAVCVRTGDGYFWPAGKSVSRRNYRSTEAECIAACPGQEVKLYIHPLGGETEDMIAASDGTPYTRLAAAHAYRTAYKAEHQCGRGVETRLIASPPAMPRSLRLARMEAAGIGFTQLAALPMPRPQFDEAGQVVAPVVADAVEAGPALVRVVGPKFLSDRLAGSIAPDRGPLRAPSEQSEGA